MKYKRESAEEARARHYTKVAAWFTFAQQTKQASGAKPPSAFGTLACLKLRRRLRFARGVMSLSGQRLAFVKRWLTFLPKQLARNPLIAWCY